MSLDILNELKEAYLSNFPSHLEEIESFVLNMEKGDDFQGNFEGLYRKVHSLKGSGGTYGFTIISSVCHQLEDFLTEAFDNQTAASKVNINIVFSYVDILKNTQELLLNESQDFTDIEQKLEDLLHSTHPDELTGIFVGDPKNVYTQMCLALFKGLNIHCSVVESGLGALQRVIHEHFDFLITSKENVDLNGLALISAIKLNNRRGSNVKTILMTSNPQLNVPKEVQPDFVAAKTKTIGEEVTNILTEIRAKI